MKTQRISIYTTQIVGQGTEVGLLRLAKGFNNRGFDVDFVYANAKAELDIPLPDDIRVVDLDASDGFLTLTSLSKMIGYLQSEQPHVMISCPGAVSIAPLLARVLTNVDTRIIAKGGKKPPKDCIKDREWRKFLFSTIMRLTYPLADEIIIGTKSSGERLLQTTPINENKLHVVPQPVVTPRILSKANETLQHHWFDNDDDIPVILSAQNLSEPKDPTTLIKAFAELRKNRPARLMILGEGKKREKLELLIDELGLNKDINMPGFLPNPYKYMRGADLFVLSSKKDNLPSALVEAMACGCSIVATDAPPGGVAWLLENGKWGKLVPVGEPDQMATAMAGSLNNPIRGAEERADRFSLERSVDEHLDVISQL